MNFGNDQNNSLSPPKNSFNKSNTFQGYNNSPRQNQFDNNYGNNNNNNASPNYQQFNNNNNNSSPRYQQNNNNSDRSQNQYTQNFSNSFRNQAIDNQWNNNNNQNQNQNYNQNINNQSYNQNFNNNNLPPPQTGIRQELSLSPERHYGNQDYSNQIPKPMLNRNQSTTQQSWDAVKPLIDRISTMLKGENQNHLKFFGNLVEKYDNTETVFVPQFIRKFEDCRLKLKAKDAGIIAEYFLLGQSRGLPNQNDKRVDIEAMWQVIVEHRQYNDKIFTKHFQTLDTIKQALQMRHSGVFMWFQSQSVGGGSLNENQFIKAVQNCDVKISLIHIKNLFQALIQDPLKSSNINVSAEFESLTARELEEVFKAYSLHKNEKENSSQSLENTMSIIVQAFAGQTQFIFTELGKKQLRQDYGQKYSLIDQNEFIMFFTKWVDANHYYSDANIVDAAEQLTQQKGQIDLTQFIQDLNQLQRKVQLKPGFRGIQDGNKIKIAEGQQFLQNSFQDARYAPEVTLGQIVKAFNCHIQFIEQNLSAKIIRERSNYGPQTKQIPLPDFLTFFNQYTNAVGFYSEDDIYKIANFYQVYEAKAQNLVDLDKFILAMREHMANARYQQQPGQAGIQYQGTKAVQLQTATGAGPSLSVPEFHTNGSKTENQKKSKQRPHNFISTLDNDALETIQKACYVAEANIADFFAKYLSEHKNTNVYPGREAGMDLDGFTGALLSNSKKGGLGIEWNTAYCALVFRALVDCMNQGQQILTPTHIDDYVYFAGIKKLRDLHNELLTDLARALKDNQYNDPIQYFVSVVNNSNYGGHGNHEINGDQLTQELRQLHPSTNNKKWDDLNFMFIGAKYSPGAHRIDTRRLGEDLRQIIAGISPTDDFATHNHTANFDGRNAIKPANQVIKIIKKAVKGYDLDLAREFGMKQHGQMKPTDFYDYFSKPEFGLVPSIISQQDIFECFKYVNQRGKQPGLMTESELRDSFINCPSDLKMVTDAIESIEASPSQIVETIKNQWEFQNMQGNLTMVAFTQCLQTHPICISRLDANFIAQIYRLDRPSTNVNGKKFIEAIIPEQQEKVRRETLKPLTNEQSDAFEYLKLNLEKNDFKDSFVHSLKQAEKSALKTYMLGFNDLLTVFKQTFANCKAKGQIYKLYGQPEKDVSNLTNTIISSLSSQNQKYSYKEMLWRIFSREEAQELLEKKREVHVGFSANEFDVKLDTGTEAVAPPRQNVIDAPPLQVKTTSAVPSKILQEDQLNTSQRILWEIQDDLIQKKLNAKAVFGWGNSTTLAPQAFFKTVTKQFKTIYNRVEKRHISDLIHYLTAEGQPGAVNVNKLMLGLDLPKGSSPLTQENIPKKEAIQKVKADLEARRKKNPQNQVPTSVIQLLFFLNQSSNTVYDFFKPPKEDKTPSMSVENFLSQLKEVGFEPENQDNLIEGLQVDGGAGNRIDLARLRDWQNLIYPPRTKLANDSVAVAQYGQMTHRVREMISQISDWMVRNEYDVKRMVQQLDANKDGFVTKEEFCVEMADLKLPGIDKEEFSEIYDAIDVNRDGQLSVNEFGLYVKGAKAPRTERLLNLTEQNKREIYEEIDKLFREFDKNGTNKIDPVEIQQMMKSLGHILTLDQSKQIVQKCADGGAEHLDENSFRKLMEPCLLDKIFAEDDKVEELRDLFRDADIDHSGSLSVDQFQQCMKNIGKHNITDDQIATLMLEFDVDQTMALDIDEFVALFTAGDELMFNQAEAKNTFFSLKRSRALKGLDFVQAFKMMPITFVPSFFKANWTGKRSCLPSSAFKVQMDPATMLWRDVNEPHSNVANGAKICKSPPVAAFEIKINKALGVTKVAEQVIKRRAVRIGIYHQEREQYFANTAQVNMELDKKTDTTWNIEAGTHLNSVLFSTQLAEGYLDPNLTMIIFEVVIYVCKDLQSKQTTEISCGWAQASLKELASEKPQPKVLVMNGGTPTQALLSEQPAQDAKKGGFFSFSKSKAKAGQSSLEITVSKPKESWVKFHLDFMPQTCFIQKTLLPYASGYRNYMGDRLLKSIGRKPDSDIILVMFSKILDNIDIIEKLAQIYQEDFWEPMKNKDAKTCDLQAITEKTCEIITRLYPILYAQEFKLSETTGTDSACCDPELYAKRQELINSALRHGVVGAKVKQPVKSVQELEPTYMPFSIQEQNVEPWDVHQATDFRTFHQYEEQGIMNASRYDQRRRTTLTRANFSQSLRKGSNVELKLDAYSAESIKKQLDEDNQLAVKRRDSIMQVFAEKHRRLSVNSKMDAALMGRVQKPVNAQVPADRRAKTLVAAPPTAPKKQEKKEEPKLLPIVVEEAGKSPLPSEPSNVQPLPSVEPSKEIPVAEKVAKIEPEKPEENEEKDEGKLLQGGGTRRGAMAMKAAERPKIEIDEKDDEGWSDEEKDEATNPAADLLMRKKA